MRRQLAVVRQKRPILTRHVISDVMDVLPGGGDAWGRVVVEFKGQCAADDDVAVVDHEVGDTQTTSLHNSLHHDSNASRKPSNLKALQNNPIIQVLTL